jgi:biotin synthase
MNRGELLAWLGTLDERRQAELFAMADGVRRLQVGPAVHLRGLIELSNGCRRSCLYCGLRRESALPRYRLTLDEVLDCARLASTLGYGSVVLQAGEDPGLTRGTVTRMVRAIKAETDLAVTLGLGERSVDDLWAWRRAGADRYFLRFETADPALYARLHPPLPGQEPVDRAALLLELREMGYEIGSGIMVGLPGQTLRDLARSIEIFAELDLDMVGVGPWIPNPATPLPALADELAAAAGEQVDADETTTLKVVALARLACPRANIPSTTALALTAGGHGRIRALQSGANVVMPNLTPPTKRSLYEIYPGKGATEAAVEAFDGDLKQQLTRMGRVVGSGPGPSLAFRMRCKEAP